MTISRDVLGKYLRPGDVFYETGTRWGDTMIKAAELKASSIHSCELDRRQYEMASAHIDDAIPPGKGVWSIENMNSLSFLRLRKDQIDKNAVVFLDAHTDTYSPVMQETTILLGWNVPPRIILIDDIRCMKTWEVDVNVMVRKMTKAGYTIHYDDGVVPNDILVATRLS